MLFLEERFEGYVAYVVDQPTLIAPWPELDSFVRSIGPFLACAWCALERSRTHSAPVAPDGLAAQAIETLEALQVLRAVVPAASFPAARSLYEPLSWIYREPWDRVDLGFALEHALQRWGRESSREARQSLWLSLGRSEADAYLGNLLRKHRMDPDLRKQLRSPSGKDWERLSVGRKRYVLWSSMRSAASELVKSGMNERSALLVLDREIETRTRWLIRRAAMGTLAASDYCFLPSPGWRQPLILDVALATFLPLGVAYWTESPCQ